MTANLPATGFSVDQLREVATAYWGDQGTFAYRAFEWVNATLFDGVLPVPLIQWALTPHGGCRGHTQCFPACPVITLHPAIWDNPHAWSGIPVGALPTLDTIIHECIHVAVGSVGSNEDMRTSHDNPAWAAQVCRIAPLIGLGEVIASPTRRKRCGGRLLRIPVNPDAIPMMKLAAFPRSLRTAEYYATATLPF